MGLPLHNSTCERSLTGEGPTWKLNKLHPVCLIAPEPIICNIF